MLLKFARKEVKAKRLQAIISYDSVINRAFCSKDDVFKGLLSHRRTTKGNDYSKQGSQKSSEPVHMILRWLKMFLNSLKNPFC